MINQLVCEIRWLNLNFPLYHDTFCVMMFCVFYSFVYFFYFYTQTVVANFVLCLLPEYSSEMNMWQINESDKFVILSFHNW